MNLDYIAGFFDGEGSITYSRQSKQWLISIAQSEPHVLEGMRSFLNSIGIDCRIRKGALKYKCTKIPYALIIHRKRDVGKFLGLLHHKLIVKKQLAEDVCRFVRLYPTMSRRQRYACRTDRKYACATTF